MKLGTVRILAALWISLTICGCTSDGAARSRRRTAVLASMGDPGRDLQMADQGLAQDILERGPADAFTRASDATTLRIVAAGPPPQGAHPWNSLFAQLPAGARMLRMPRDGRASASGDLGWTWGDYEIQFPPEVGAAPVHGRYLTVWHRSGDGTWRISADMSEDAAP